jgi:pyruvate ferredoxin oxidoreductase alpha subunit
MHTVIAGLGGRPITRRSLRGMLDDADAGQLEPLRFLELRTDVVERELCRSRGGGRPGPHAENMLRELGIVAAGPV